jgi:hypothetical protein
LEYDQPVTFYGGRQKSGLSLTDGFRMYDNFWAYYDEEGNRHHDGPDYDYADEEKVISKLKSFVRYYSSYEEAKAHLQQARREQ